MEKKNVVSIEDRIPKLKQARKKKANRRLLFYLSIFFILISIIVYLQSPLSHVKTIHVNGNKYLTDEEIIQQSNLALKMNIWTVNRREIKKVLHKHPVIESVEVNRKLPWTIEINLKEYKFIGYIQKDEVYFPVLENGQILPFETKTNPGDGPILLDFSDHEYLQRMVDELNALPDSIVNLISEITWSPTKKNKHKVLLYMNDGFIVDTTIRDFASKMETYPSIVSQIETGSTGIIHMGIGSYFEELK